MNFLRLQELAWNSPLTPKFLMSVGLIVGAYTLHRLVRYYVGRRTHDPMVRQGYWDISRNLTIFVGAAFLLGVWLEEMKTVSLLLTGLMAATLIASKEVVLGVSGRIALATSSHFRVGDRILINGVCGDVVNIGLLYTWLLEVGGEHGENQSTGRVVVFPNLWLTLYQVSNFTHLHEFLWDEIELAFPASIAIPEAMELMNAEAEDYLKDEMQRAARALPRLIETYAARLPPVTPIVYCRLERTALGDQYVVLTLRFVTQARRRRVSYSDLTQRLTVALRAKGIPLTGVPPLPPPALGEEKAG